jgi:hypothetical protein
MATCVRRLPTSRTVRASLTPVGRRIILFALVLALAGCGGDDEKAVKDEPTTVGTSTAEKPTTRSTQTRPDSTAQQRTTPPEVLTNGPRRDVTRTIGQLVQAVELGDGKAFCTTLGRDPGGSQGVAALRACGRQAGIDPFGLPTSDEFSVSTVQVQGASATARLGGGQTVRLRRQGGRWRIVSFRP